MLKERDKILEQLDALLIQSTRGRGAIAAISGSTAIGKTTTLNALAERATSADITVLSVVSSPHEREVPYSALAQLLHSIEAQCTTADVPRAGGAGTVHAGRQADEAAALAPPLAQDDPMTVARRTYQIIAELTALRPLLITVDDIQHTDTATLTCLRYLAQRLTQLSLALVFTHGISVDEQPARVLDDLLYRTSARHFHLEPLSRVDIMGLAANRLPVLPSDRLIVEIHRLSGGNPLLAQALIEEHRLRLASDSVAGPMPPQSDGIGRRSTTEGGASIGPAFYQAVLAYLHRLGPRAVRLARCVALLDEATTPLLLSRLSGIDTELSKRYLRLFTGLGVLEGARLRHAGVRQAVLGEMPHGEATQQRYRAARLLNEGGAPPQAVAMHLLGVGPLHDGWVLPVLQEAAAHAMEDGDVPQGIRYLELACECSLDEGQRLSAKSLYAFGQWQLRPAESAPHFRALKGPILEGKLTGTDALWVAEGMLFHLDFDEAVEVVDHVNSGEADMSTALHSTRMLMAAEVPGLLERLEHPLPATTAPATSHSELRARHALALILENGADKYAIALADQVFQGSQNWPTSKLSGLPKALLALCYADQLDTAAAWYDLLAAEVERHDAPGWWAQIESVGALLALRRGRLADAVRQAETAHARLSGPRWNVSSALALTVLIEAHTAMGNHQTAAKYLETSEPPPALFLTRAGLHYLYARGRHHLATGNTYLALSDFQECGTLMRRWNIDTPSLAPWRLGEAEVWLRLGDQKQAARLVEKQLANPDAGLTRSRGMTLHALALVQATAKQPPILRDAFRLLEAAGARYEAARVLADLSRAYQQLGDKQARPTARRAWRLAKSCQAESLCQALLPTSIPQNMDTKPSEGSCGADRAGQDSFGTLSESERRVATLAAQGYANREIAERLFITVSTVEQHLTRVYRKMGIRNREQLLQRAHAVSYESV